MLSWGGHSALTPRPGSCNFGKRTASSQVWYPPWPGRGQVGQASTKSRPGLPAATDLKRPPGPPAAESTQPAWSREDAPGGAGSSQSLSPTVSRTKTTKQRQTKKRTDGLASRQWYLLGGRQGLALSQDLRSPCKFIPRTCMGLCYFFCRHLDFDNAHFKFLGKIPGKGCLSL